MGGHRGLNFEGESQGVAALAGGDSGLLAGADGVEEGFDLETQWLAGGDFGLDEREAGGRA